MFIFVNFPMRATVLELGTLIEHRKARTMDQFHEDFMIRGTEKEFAGLRSQFVASKKGRGRGSDSDLFPV